MFSNEGRPGMNTNELRKELKEKLNPALFKQYFGEGEDIARQESKLSLAQEENDQGLVNKEM